MIRRAEAGDGPAVEAFLARHNSLEVARRGVLERPLEHPMLLAEEGGQLLGVLTYVLDPPSCEVLTIHIEERWRGLGSALIAEVRRLAAADECRRLWLVTTNDNVDALRFYQRRGFRLGVLRAGAVDDARARLKPGIPTLGAYGIPLRDELDLDLDLDLDPVSDPA